jgi:CBS domain-containing protein
MISPVRTTTGGAPVTDAAATMVKYHISALPVVDDHGKLIGIITEGDLVHRVETDTERRRPWWLRLLADERALAAEYIKSHSRAVRDVMTRDVVTATPETPLHEIASIFGRKSIKRVPIVENDQLVGIVSRANLVQALASVGKGLDIAPSDKTIREKLISHLRDQSWASTASLNVTVSDGIVDLWGLVDSDAERKAMRVAAETIPGVRAVNDNLTVWPTSAVT